MQTGQIEYQGHEPPNPAAASHRGSRRGKPVRPGSAAGDRAGPAGAWLALAAPPAAPRGAPLAERERVRAAEQGAFVALGTFVAGLALIPVGVLTAPALGLAGALIAAAVVACALNRTGHAIAASLLLVATVTLGLAGALAALPALDLAWTPALYFFAVPVALAGALLPPLVPFAVAAFGSVAVLLLLALQPRDPAFAQVVAHLGVSHFLAGPIGLMVAVAVVSWLAARSAARAVAEGDRAVEVAALRYALLEQQRQVEHGVQTLLETHVRAAGGDLAARANLGRDNPFWQVALSLNNLLVRLGRQVPAELRLQRTEQELDRLAAALAAARGGQRVAWPEPSGTRVDVLADLLRQGGVPARSAPILPPAALPQHPAVAPATPPAPYAPGPTEAVAYEPYAAPPAARPGGLSAPLLGGYDPPPGYGPATPYLPWLEQSLPAHRDDADWANQPPAAPAHRPPPMPSQPLSPDSPPVDHAEGAATPGPLSARHERGPRGPRYTRPLQPSPRAARGWSEGPLPPLPPSPWRNTGALPPAAAGTASPAGAAQEWPDWPSYLRAIAERPERAEQPEHSE